MASNHSCSSKTFAQFVKASKLPAFSNLISSTINNQSERQLMEETAVNQAQLETRKLKAQKGLVLTRTQRGYQVHSKSHPGTVYNVTVERDRVICDCPDFELNQDDESWQCKHVVAALAEFESETAASARPFNGNGKRKEPMEQESLKQASQEVPLP